MRRRPAWKRPRPTAGQPPRKVGLLAEAWQSYRDEILVPARAGALQIRETRRAFYAGALTVLAACERIGEPDIPERDGMQVLSGIKRELALYKESIGTPEEMITP